MNVFIRLWQRVFKYYFPPREPPHAPIFIESIRNKKPEFHEIAFFEPITPREVFDKSESLEGFIKTIDNL